MKTEKMGSVRIDDTTAALVRELSARYELPQVGVISRAVELLNDKAKQDGKIVVEYRPIDSEKHKDGSK